MLMKKLFTTLFLLALGGVILETSLASAYELYVGGKEVTGSSLSTGGAIKSGTIKYNNSTKELTLTNVVINVDGTAEGIWNKGIDGLKIYFEGTCSITTPVTGILLGKSTTLSSTTGGTLNIDVTGGTASSNYCCIWQKNGGTLTIEWLHLNYKGLNYGICGTAGSPTETFKALCCELKGSVTGTHACVSQFASVTTYSNFWNENLTYSNNELRNGDAVAKTASLVAELKVGQNIIDTHQSNQFTISGSEKGFSSGYIKFYHDKILTLNDVTFTATGKDIFAGRPYSAITNYGVDGLQIYVIGTNVLNSASGDLTIGIHSREMYKSFNAAFYIFGHQNSESYSENKLTINTSGTRSYGILTDGSLTVDKVDLTINCSTNSTNHGIYGGDLGKSDLEVTNSKVTVDASASGKAIQKFNSCKIEYCDVKTEGVNFFTAYKAFTDMSGNIANKVEIDKPVEWYYTYILGRRVNDFNKDNVVVDGQTAGKISYDPETYVLTLDGVKLKAPDSNKESAILVSKEDIPYKVKLVGSNEITANHNVFEFWPPVTITGSGSFTGTANEWNGIQAYHNDVTIETSNYFQLFALANGFYGGNDNTLTLKKASSDGYGYTFQGGQDAIYHVGNLVLDNMDFAYDNGNFNHDGCYFEEGYVKLNGGKTAGGSKRVAFHSIKEKLGFSIAGKEVNRVLSESYKISVGSPYITAGGGTAVVYDPQTKKLVLDNATIDMGDDNNPCIKNNGLSGLTISVNGTNDLKVSNAYSCMRIEKSTVISSETKDFNSSLNCYGPANGAGIYLYGSNPVLTVKDKALVTADAGRIGIGGNNNGNLGETLNVNDASIYVTSGGIKDLKNFSIANATIRRPADGYFSSDKKGIVNVHGGIANEVLILSNNDIVNAIDAIEVDSDAEVRDIFDASGRRLDGTRQGLNIIRMYDGTTKKVVVK